MIDVVFHSDEKQQIEIRRFWKRYLDHLNDRDYPQEAWGIKRVELLVELLYAMVIYLGFDLDKTHIKNQSYFPDGYGQIENDNAANRQALREVLTGQKSLSMHITNFPSSETRTENH